jgi:hypothetical protein
MQTTPLPRDTTMVWCCICSTCAYWSEESTHHLMIMSLSAEMVSFVCQMPQSSCRSSFSTLSLSGGFTAIPFLVLAEIKILTSYHTIMLGYMQVGGGQMIDTPSQLSANNTTIMFLPLFQSVSYGQWRQRRG